ncbi:SusC/RagA family TonB-linked outer membrane protein [Pseudoflavitalea sp. G-6-1-2]|uniref:SusC/RagA family TonB-linked outer membrane protein n=1 Tax=Pseudoflavitalea sp. G-6-1-2 TaxID=2728841 RepID=UPI001469A150|nr:SusC/RagA family TonB-linked outer membrane protein [Pseudoflavitalea sp. G-6-1-2]NML21583.1 SusC/RagA family TonB-linked outer membrane protein [Pseudoflavitalea sp. G-6-1-2]
MKSIFQTVKDQTGYIFFFNEELLENARPVSVTAKDMPLDEFLRLVFRDQPIDFKIRKKTIFLSEKINRKFIPDLNIIAPDTLKKITGRVTDPSGNPLSGASVSLKKNKSGTQSNAKGEFVLEHVGDNDIVLISYTGYTSQEIKLNAGQLSLFVVMKLKETELNEVTINTGIFNRNKASYTGAVTVVTSEELAAFGNRNLITSLRNIDPSFNIVANNAMGSNPNRLPELQIRGNSSLPNVNELKDDTRVGMNTPLIILDGFESTLQKLLDINQNEVETITILKDAAATAIYGSRGANGVVVIKTRVPKPGKLQIGYRFDTNIEMPDLTAYDLLNAREKLDLEYKTGYYDDRTPEKDLKLKQYYNYLLSELNRGVETDWMSKPLRTGIGQRHNLSLSGGTTQFRYSASLQLNDLQGVMKGSFRRVLNGSVSLMYQFKNFRFTNNLMISAGNSQESPYGDFAEYAKQNPYLAPYDARGRALKLLGDPGAGIDYSLRFGALPPNPLYDATLNSFRTGKSTQIVNNISAEWNLNPDLVFRARFGIFDSHGNNDEFFPAEHTRFATTADIFKRGSYSYTVNKGFNFDGGVNLSYNRQFGQHALFGGLDYNIRQMKANSYSFGAQGFVDPQFDDISMALQYTEGGKPGGTESLARSVGITSNLSYGYAGKYYVEGSMRVDGSSQFGEYNRFAPFWSVGLGWNLSKESFFHSDFITRLNIRGSVGVTGSQNFDAYQAQATYGYYMNDRYYGWLGADLQSLGNKNLKWQQKMNYNIGTEIEILKKRVAMAADYYVGITNGLISSINLPASNGFDSYIENIGKVSNKGFELKATVFVIRNSQKQITWSISGAVVRNINKIEKISDALKEAQKGIEDSVNISPATLYREGNPIATIWAVKSLGIDPSTGREVYLDRNGQPTYVWSPKDMRASGLSEPKYFGNFSTMFRYKEFSINLAFGYRTGGQTYNQTLATKVENSDYNYNVDRRVYEQRWQKPGDKATYKGLKETGVTNATSRFVQNENTVTLNNVNLQYDIRSGFIKKMKMTGLSVAANMADVFYFSSVRQERGTTYPFSRQVSLSISATF